MAEDIRTFTDGELDEETRLSMERVEAETAKRLAAGDESLPSVFRPQTKEELHADLDLALEQMKRGEYISLEEFEEEMAREFGDELPSGIDAAGKHKSA